MSSIGSGSIADFVSPAVPGRSHRGLIAAGLALLALTALVSAPLVANDYWLNAVLIPFLIMSLTGLGLNILMGYAGQASLGTGGFMSVGAYATYNLLLRLPELPLPVSLLLGGMIAGVVGLIAGLFSLRIKGFYLIAPTLATQFFLEWLFNQYGWFSNYSTSSSISAPRLAFLGVDLSSPVGRYVLTLATVAIITMVTIRLVNSQTGRTWMAIRDMDTAASVIGIPVVAGKLKAFFISSAMIGIAGALWAFAYLGTVDAGSFNLDRSFAVMFIIICGGMGTVVGSYLGAAFMMFLPILLDHVGAGVFGGAIDQGQLANFQKALFGALIIWFLIKEPNGLAALVERLGRWLARFVQSQKA